MTVAEAWRGDSRSGRICAAASSDLADKTLVLEPETLNDEAAAAGRGVGEQAVFGDPAAEEAGGEDDAAGFVEELDPDVLARREPWARRGEAGRRLRPVLEAAVARRAELQDDRAELSAAGQLQRRVERAGAALAVLDDLRSEERRVGEESRRRGRHTAVYKRK